jgi:integrase
VAGKRNAGEGSIFQRSDNRWCAQLDLGFRGGKRRRRYVYASSAQAVRKQLTELRHKLDRGERIDITTGTLAAFAPRWIENIAPDLKPRTVHTYRQLLESHILPTLGGKQLSAITRVDIKRLLTAKRLFGLAKNTVRLIRACLSALYAEAVDEGLVAHSPVLALARRDRNKRTSGASSAERLKTIRPFSAEELRAFLTATRTVEPTVYPLFLLLARTGLRPGEAFALKWSDLDFTRREILVERALSAGIVGTTKTGTIRKVDMSQELAATLNHLRRERDQQKLARGWRDIPEWIFVNRVGKQLEEEQIRLRFIHALKAAGLSGHRVYDLRHTFATTLLTNGAPITYVAAQLGHSKPTTTLQWYAHWLPASDRGYVDGLDDHSFSGTATAPLAH